MDVNRKQTDKTVCTWENPEFPVCSIVRLCLNVNVII